MIELELKAVVPDAARLRARLLSAGADPGFAGLMHDRRFDRHGELAARDEVLRTRRYEGAGPGGADRVRVSWKGPVSVDRGYKRRPELEYEVQGDGPAEALFAALGFQVIETIDRYVEYWRLGGATLRIEWYPRMDVLVEVEGEPQAIEAAIAASGLDRAAFTADALVGFVARYQVREGHPAVTALDGLRGEAPTWSRR